MKNKNTLTCKEFVEKYKGVAVKVLSKRENNSHYADGIIKGCKEQRYGSDEDWIVLSNFVYSVEQGFEINVISENSLGYETFIFIPLLINKDDIQDLINKLEL